MFNNFWRWFGVITVFNVIYVGFSSIFKHNISNGEIIVVGAAVGIVSCIIDIHY